MLYDMWIRTYWMTPDAGEPRRMKSEEVMPSTYIQSFNRISDAGTFRSFIILVVEIRQKDYIYQISAYVEWASQAKPGFELEGFESAWT